MRNSNLLSRETKERLLENEYIQADETTLQVVNAQKQSNEEILVVWLV
ncbi:MAG: hypothetical protein Q9M36_03240 [Sulfurovum sp.]|nr:hypothetical protein [Sulfurovum sp.]